MYSGSDSTESQNYSQWALNPSTYQNMSNDQVDWAALAQQWIIMKEAGPPPVIPHDAKPKPKKEPLNEGGEAPMDVETEKEESTSEWNDWSWNAQNQTWGWSNSWTPPTGVPPPIPVKPPLLPTPASNYNQFSSPPETSNDNASFGGYSTGQNNDYASGYWTSASGSKQVKPHNRRFSKVNVPRPVQAVSGDAPPALDANKRKQLPAWIREGLEKMERDKQKQMEREKEKQERDEYNEKLKQNEKETMEILKSTIKEQQKSKFESDGDSSEEEAVAERKKQAVAEPVALTPAEQMMNVRRAMTEILLKVTNREIETICREELQRHLKKHKASDRRASAPSGANLTAKLGLGIYGGDSGSSSGDDSDGAADQRDSDAELKDSIKRKRAEFTKTEKQIEEKLSEGRTPPTNDKDTQVDAKSQGRRVKRKSRSPSTSSDASSYKRRSSTSSSRGEKKRERSRSATPPPRRKAKAAKRERSRSRYSRRSRSRSRNRRARRSPYSRGRRTRSRSRSRRRRSRSSSGGRGKRTRRR